MATNQGFKSFIPKASKLDAGFLFWWLKCHRSYLEGLGNGATFKEVSKSVVARIEIPLPPLAEQRRIATILDHADNLWQQRRLALGRLDGLTQSVFLHIFGDPRQNPKGWKFVCLGDVLHSASDGPHVSPRYAEDGVPFLSTRHIKRGEVMWEDLKFITRDDAKTHWKKCKPEKGDILYIKGGTTGIAAAVDFDRAVAIWVHVALLKLKRDMVAPEWLEVKGLCCCPR